jgi:hypothetical protein
MPFALELKLATIATPHPPKTATEGKYETEYILNFVAI